jgi:hypothetical protein
MRWGEQFMKMHIETIGVLLAATVLTVAAQGENHYLLTEVIPAKQTVQLGDPIVVSLRVTNQTAQTAFVSQFATEFGGFEVIDPDGKRLPYIGDIGQIFGGSKTNVQPHSAIIAGGADLTDKYLFQKPGLYSIRFSAGPSDSQATNIWSDSSYMGLNPPNSKAITIQVNPGQLSEIDEIIASLLPVCPKGWYLAKFPRMLSRPFGPGFGLQLYHDPMQREAVDLWFSKEEVKVAPDQPLRFEMVYWGHARGQLVYGSVGTNAPALWPTAIEDISRALQITKQ